MTPNELLAIIETEEHQSIGANSGQLAEQRRKAMQYYYGQPYGNEIEGRSQVVTTETLDAIEGILPSLLAIFTSSDEVVRFEAQQQEDEAAAQQATDYVNYIFSRVNNGFLSLYCFFKDALLQKNGFLKVYYEEYSDTTKETYEDLNELEFVQMMQDDDLELIEADKEEGEPDPTTGMPTVAYNAKFRRTKESGKVCIDPVPPEEVLVSRNCPNDIKKARFVEHKCKKTISQLREMGFKVKDDLADEQGGEANDWNSETIERNKFDDDQQFQETGTNDPSTREVWVREAYLYVDYDKDGVAELRKVTKVGKTILDNEEIDSMPFVTATPILMPHKLYGMSIADLVMPIQEIKSSVTRSLMDNFYFINNGRYEVLDGMVNIGDLLTNRPGGIVRSKVLGAVKRIDTPALGNPAYQMLEYWDNVTAARVGKRTFSPGPNADVLTSSATGADIYKQWDMERTELIARLFAETGVKDLFWKIMELVSKHQNKPQVVKLRGQWVPVDPREWKNKFNMTVTVGLGNGSKQTIMQGAMGILNIQGMLAKMGGMGRVVTENNLYEAAKGFAKGVDPRNADSYFTNPATLPPAQPQPNPEMLKLQLADKKATMGDAQKRAKMAQDFQTHIMDLMHEKQMSSDDFAREMAKFSAQMNHDQGLQTQDYIHQHVQKSMDREHQDRTMQMQHGHEMRGKQMDQSHDMNGRQMDQQAEVAREERQAQREAAQPIVVNTTQDLDLVAKGMEELAKGITESAQMQMESSRQTAEMIARLLEEMQKKGNKSVTVKRDAKGNLIGAEVVEE